MAAQRLSRYAALLTVAVVLGGLLNQWWRHDATADFSGAPAALAQTRAPLAVDTIPFPHSFLYSGINSSGWPYVGNLGTTGVCSSGGAACAFSSDCTGYTQSCANPSYPSPLASPINQAVIAAASRYQFMSVPPTPTIDIRPDIYTAIRQANPNQYLLAYTMGSTTWCPYADAGHLNSYPVGSYYRGYWLAATGGDPSCDYQGDRLLWAQDGTAPSAAMVNVNIAKRLGDEVNGYTYPVADAVAENIFTFGIANQKFDGVFVDVMCDNIGWMESGGFAFDYARAGYTAGNGHTARENFLSGWKAGHTELARKLRELATAAGYPDFAIYGNCNPGPVATYPYLNGWMREGFPYQDGGDWFTNMYSEPGGMFMEAYRYRSPQQNFVFTPADPYWQPVSMSNQRKMRFGLGTASLANSMSAFHESSGGATISPNYNFWYDEYGVNVITGQADATKTGWLGMPKGPAYQVINPNTNANLVPVSGFETGMDNWSLSVSGSAAATVTREVGSAADGGTAVHVAASQVMPYDYSVNFTHSSAFTITANQEYSVTFWAKADHQRTITVAFDRPAAGGYAARHQPIDTTWRRYQVMLKPLGSHADSNIWFSLGAEIGDVWLDDIRVQPGFTSLYRRDFDHGTVLVNPGLQTQTVQLDKPYYKILGTINPSLNDGSMVSQVTVAGTSGNAGIGDALFLVDMDKTPPSKIQDLSAQ